LEGMGELHTAKDGGVRDAQAAKLFTRKQSPSEVPDVRCTFSTLTLFSHTFSTVPLASFHDYSWHFHTPLLILFHDNKRPHTKTVQVQDQNDIAATHLSKALATISAYTVLIRVGDAKYIQNM
jgi:hypothetical protein